MKEQSESKVELNDLDSDAVESVLNYIYSGDVEATSDNAKQIIMAADFLLLEKLKVAVDQYMAKVVKDISSDYLSTYLFAVRFKCTALKEAAKKMVCEHFEDVAQNSDFLDISLDMMQEFIANDDIVVSSENIIFKAVVDWVNHNKAERKHEFPQLFARIRLCSFSEGFLQSSVITESLVMSSQECLKLVMESMKNRTSPPTTANIQHPRCCLDSYTNAILVFPTGKTNVVRGPWCYVPSEDQWYHVPIPGNRRTSKKFGYGHAVYHEGAVYMIRTNDETYEIAIDRFDLKTNSWLNLTSLVYEIDHFNVVCFQGCVYFIGGNNGYKSVADVKSFDLASAVMQNVSLKNVAPMKHKRFAQSIVCDENYIYVIGGVFWTHDGKDVEYCHEVERYSPQTNSWDDLGKTISRSGRDQCAISGGKIFRVLGMNGKGNKHNEVYDIRAKSLSKLQKPSLYIECGILAVCDEQLFLIGSANIPPGLHNDKNEDNKEILHTLVYNCKAEKWSDMPAIHLKNNASCSSVLDLSGTTVRLPKAFIAGLTPLSDVSP